MKLELSIRANQLKNVAGALRGTSDPFAIVTRISLNSADKPVVVGKTEVIKNSLNPDWVKVFPLEYELGTPQKVAINIFDEVRKGNNIGMGSVVFDVDELLGARGNTQAKRLKKGGNLFATIRKSEGRGSLCFKFKAERLKNVEGFFSKSDPFFEISRKVSTVGGQNWDVVFRSEHIPKNLNPDWEEGSVELSILCGGDLNQPIDISVFDHEKSGKHTPMGSIETTVSALVERGKNGANQMSLMTKGKKTGTLIISKAEIMGCAPSWSPPTQQMAAANLNGVPVVTSVTAAGVANGKIAPMAPPPMAASLATSVTSAGVAVGAFVPMAPPGVAQSYQRATSNKELFVDYMSGGCELSVAVAIDFTGSNGDPRTPGTLHHIDPSGYARNTYEQAISAIVSILLKFDHDQKIPVLGFGAKYDGVVRHAFQCGPVAEASGLHGVMDAYKSVFSSGVILSRPTVFNEVLETAAEKANTNQAIAQSRGGQAYTILLIVTDGAVSDVHSTAACLSRVSNSPLSVVIVGVGDADFSGMQFLDDSAIGTGSRDIAQFVAFNQHAHSSQSLTKATLEEIPQQLVEYFQRRGMAPLPPVIRGGDSFANLMGEAEEEINLNLDIGEEEIVVSGGGYGYVDGFNAR